MHRIVRGAVIGALALGTMFQAAPSTALAEEFDVTGTLECGQMSGRRCQFSDWSTGPAIGVITKDISGNTERVVLDASWVREDLSRFDQDDFVWFTVRDDTGPKYRITGVVEHRCNEGKYNLGLSTGSYCVKDNGERVDKD